VNDLQGHSRSSELLLFDRPLLYSASKELVSPTSLLISAEERLSSCNLEHTEGLLHYPDDKVFYNKDGVELELHLEAARNAATYLRCGG